MMKRREFVKTSALSVAAAAVASSPLGLLSSCTPARKGSGTELKISFQDTTCGKKSYAEMFDYMESLGVVGFEPHGQNLIRDFDEIKRELQGRDIKVSAICAGFSGFILAEDGATKASFDSSMREIIAKAGELGSTGVIMVPAFNGQIPVRPHTIETRNFLCEQLHELGEYALECGTTVILEPLNRKEAFYLRQVGDAAAICRDSQSEGVKCMGDFWHMQEETSDYAALMSAGKKYLQHVHIASRGNRAMPGEDGELDNYIEGFRALKELEYQNYVSFECKSIGERKDTLPAAVALMREQWEIA